MRGFQYIFELQHPEIDIHRCAFDHPSDRNTIVNEDFIMYSFLNTLHYGGITNADFSRFNALCAALVVDWKYIR